jgi:N-acetyl-alpha-D-muramate 1-phosphate uridylyltransferase
MKAMILSAGMGSRMGCLTKNIPKPLLKIGNQTLLEIQINKLIQAGISQFLINVSYLGDQIIEFVSDKYKNISTIEIQFSEEDQPLETAGGIVNALEFFDNNPFLVTNADIFTHFDYSILLKHELSDDVSAFLILVPNPEFKTVGDYGLESNKLTFNKDFTYSGIGIYRKEMFQGFKKGEKIKLKSILDDYIINNKIDGSLYHGYWSDIGTEERLVFENKKNDNQK